MTGKDDKVTESVGSGLSRRKFLRLGTAAAVSVGLADALTRRAQHGDGAVASAHAGGAIVVDTAKCAGCRSCMLACALAHHGVEDLSRSNINIAQDSFGAYPNDLSVHVCGTCDLCSHTPYWNEQGGPDGKHACVEVCQMRAVTYQP